MLLLFELFFANVFFYFSFSPYFSFLLRLFCGTRGCGQDTRAHAHGAAAATRLFVPLFFGLLFFTPLRERWKVPGTSFFFFSFSVLRCGSRGRVCLLLPCAVFLVVPCCRSRRRRCYERPRYREPPPLPIFAGKQKK